MSLFEFATRDCSSVMATHPAVFQLNPNLTPAATGLVISAGAGLELPDPTVKSCHLAPSAAAALAVLTWRPINATHDRQDRIEILL